MEFAVLDAATFANFDTAGFWLPCEEVQLLWSLIEHVELHGKGLAPLIEGLHDRRSKVVLEQSKTSIVKALQMGFQHIDVGIYARVETAGIIRAGDTIISET